MSVLSVEAVGEINMYICNIKYIYITLYYITYIHISPTASNGVCVCICVYMIYTYTLNESSCVPYITYVYIHTSKG